MFCKITFRLSSENPRRFVQLRFEEKITWQNYQQGIFQWLDSALDQDWGDIASSNWKDDFKISIVMTYHFWVIENQVHILKKSVLKTLKLLSVSVK